MHRRSDSNPALMKENLGDIQVTEESPDLLAGGEQHYTVNTKYQTHAQLVGNTSREKTNPVLVFQFLLTVDV